MFCIFNQRFIIRYKKNYSYKKQGKHFNKKMVKKIVNWLNYCSGKSLLLKLEQKTEYITKNRKAKV